MPTIRLLLVDPNEIFIQDVQSALDSQQEIRLVAYSTSIQDILSLCAEKTPHIIMIGQLDSDSLDIIRALRRQHPESRIISITNQIDADHARQHLNAGVIGYLLQNDVLLSLSDSIVTAYQGKTIISTEITRALL
ncbi:MAG: hypothetical protein Q9P01_08765 [Anaerolineae bacterium]|nr:hypothetical protein [Anaerolineae bacterium]MDQ7034912.1 hypothetical protein [Anaerolineae bacterium]